MWIPRFDDLDVRYINGRRWMVLRPFRYYSPCGRLVHVEQGFITDFASTPRFVWRIFPPTGVYGKAAVIHDYMYAKGEARRLADDMLFEGMRVLGTPRWEAWAFWLAVRLFGRKAYREHRLLRECPTLLIRPPRPASDDMYIVKANRPPD